MRAMQLVSQMLAQTSPSTHSSSFSALTPCPPSVTCTEPALHDAGATQVFTHHGHGDKHHQCIICWTALSSQQSCLQSLQAHSMYVDPECRSGACVSQRQICTRQLGCSSGLAHQRSFEAY